MIERFLSSPRFHWLFRVGWIERFIFLTIRWFGRFSKRVEKILDLNLFGFDFSKWQGAINFLKVYLYGAKFLVLRASYGLTADERFVQYMESIIHAIAEVAAFFLVRLSVYGYYYPQYDPIAQANKLLEVIEPYRRYIRRVWGDFEFLGSGAYSAPSHWQRYAQTIINAGYEFGVYTRKTWWDSRVGNYAAWFGQFPLWATQYAEWLTLIPAGWTKASIWQKGILIADVGTDSEEVDLDVADNEFYAAEYGTVPEPPPEEEPMANGTARESGGRTSTVRSSPGVVSGNDTNRRIAPWSVIEWVELVTGTNNPLTDKWFKLPDGNYVQYIYNGRQYYNILTEPTVPEPPPATTMHIVATLPNGDRYEGDIQKV